MIGMYCDVSFYKNQLTELLKGIDDSQGLFLFSINFMRISVLWARSRELKL